MRPPDNGTRTPAAPARVRGHPCLFGRLPGRLTVLVLLLFCGPPLARAQAPEEARPPEDVHYSVRHWTTADGLPVNFIFDIAQTPDGYLWLATAGGVVRFNGIDFHVYTREDVPGWRGHFVTRLFMQADGTLWAGTLRGELARRTGRGWEAVPVPGAREYVNMRWLEDADGRLWIASTGGVVRVEGDSVRTFSTDDGLPSPRVAALHQLPGGEIWAVTNGGLARWTGAGFEAEGASLPFESNGQASLVRGDGSLWARYEGGVAVLGERGLELRPDARIPDSHLIERSDGTLLAGGVDGLYAEASGGFRCVRCTGAQTTPRLEDRAGGVWIQEGGDVHRVLRWDGEHFAHVLGGDGAFGVAVAFYEDAEGTVWVGTDSGLFALTPQVFRAYTRRDGLAEDFARALLEDRAGRLWVGTWGGGVHRFEGERFRSLGTGGAQHRDFVNVLYEDRSGRLWVGARFGYGILTARGLTRWRTVETGVREFLEDRAGRLWAGGGELFVLDADGEVVEKKEAPGEVRALLEDREGTVWIGTRRGLLRVRGDSARHFTAADGLVNEFVEALYEDAEGLLWVGTQSGGLHLLRGERFEALGRAEGLHSDGIWDIVEDDEGYFWMVSDRGVGRASRQGLLDVLAGRRARVDVRRYDEADGLPSAEGGNGSPGAWRTRDGRLWFATIKGLAVVDPARLSVNARPPPVRIERLVAGGREAVPGAQVVLEPGARHLEVHYAGLSYVAPEKNRYRYRLEGVDAGWVEAGARRAAFYTNVPPGRYTFRAQASNSDGVWNEAGAAMTLVVPALMHETAWFRAGLVLLVLTVLGTVTYYRGRYERARELEQMRRRIADDLHDDVASKIGSVAVRLDLLSRNGDVSEAGRAQVQEALASTRRLAHDLRDTVWIVHAENDGLRELVGRMEQTARELLAGHTYRIDVPAGLPDAALGMEARRHLFLLYKEALHNVVRHAEARHVDVEIGYAAPVLTLVVTDDGRGFDVEQVRPGRGLGSLQRRAEAVGGRLEVKSVPGRGTMVRLRAALGAEAQRPKG